MIPFVMTDLDSRRGNDVADFAIGFLDRWANGLTAAALSSDDQARSGPDPDGLQSLSQERGSND